MKHHNTVARTAKLAQPGVRIDSELWKRCQKLKIDLGIPTRQFMEEALEDRAKRARQELRDRRESGSAERLALPQGSPA